MQELNVKKKIFICDECGKGCVNAAKLNSHKIVHSKKKPFKCAQCSKSFKRLITLKVHEKSHEDHKVICSICGKHINSRALLNRHMVFHSEEKKYKCNFCEKKFRRSDAFKHHLILHSRLKPYECVFCDLTFADGSNCRKHQKTAHPLELATAEALGMVRVCKNVPKIEQLKAINNNILLKPHARISLIKEKQFVCDICAKETTSSRSLEVHKLIHIKATLKCDMCSRLFKNEERLNIHKRKCNVQCLICNLKLKNNQSLKEHVLLHTDIKNFKCTLCKYATKHRRNLKAHMLTHTGLKPYQCSYCDVSYTDQSNCKKHMKHAHPTKVSEIQSNKTNKKNVPKFKELNEMMEQMKRNMFTKEHMKNEENEWCDFVIDGRMAVNENDAVIEDSNGKFPQAKVTKLDKTFSSKPKIKNLEKANDILHNLTFDKKKTIAECGICNKTFRSKGACASHLKSKHSIVSKPTPCKFCGKLFKAVSAHEKHEVTHLPPEKRDLFQCTQCNKKFLWEKHLKIHVKTVHIGKNSFICEECGKGYLTLNTLNMHKIVHSNERPFKCSKCTKSFKRVPALKEHLRNSHAETKNFKCQLCQYACRDRRNLKTHMLIHAGLKPYHCLFCEISYSDPSNCKKHEKHSHPAEYAEMKSKRVTGVHSKNVPTFCELKEIISQIKQQTS